MIVIWNKEKCLHAGVCVTSLPEVFKVADGGLIINMSSATEEEILSVVDKCPAKASSIIKEVQ